LPANFIHPLILREDGELVHHLIKDEQGCLNENDIKNKNFI
jgi:hypothetical protein